MHSKSLRRVTSMIAITAFLTGCGAPSLEAMKPSVWKPSALVVFVDHPSQWTASAAENVLTAQNVVTKVVSTSSKQLTGVLQQSLAAHPVSLYVVVSEDAPPQSAVELAAHHLGQRFEWVTSQRMSANSVNVRQVVNNTEASDYTLGWLAATLASGRGPIPTVGWLAGTPDPSVLPKAVCAGMFAGNATVTLLPVIPPTSLGAATTVPPIILTGHPLSSSERSWLASTGATVISLCRQSDTHGLLAEPGFPGPDAVGSDAKALASMKWASGVQSVVSNPPIRILGSGLPASVLASLQALAISFAGGQLDVNRIWNQIPANLRASWSGIVGLTG